MHCRNHTRMRLDAFSEFLMLQIPICLLAQIIGIARFLDSFLKSWPIFSMKRKNQYSPDCQSAIGLLLVQKVFTVRI